MFYQKFKLGNKLLGFKLVIDLKLCIFFRKPVTLSNPFVPHAHCEKPHRILLEGAVGSGKTTYLQHLLYKWTTGEDEKLTERFKMVFYINLKLVGKDKTVMDAIVEQCLPPTFKRSPNELFTAISGKQSRTLLLLDGYECLRRSPNNDFHDVLEQRRLREVAVILAVTSQRYLEQSLLKMFDGRLALLGFKESDRDEYINKYSQLTGKPAELMNHLTTEIFHSPPTRVQAFSLNPLYCKFLCLISEYEGNISDITTEAYLIYEFVAAIKKHFCAMKKLKMAEDGSLPQWVQDTVHAIEDLAYQQSLTCKVAIDTRLIHMKHKNSDLFNTGLLTQHSVGQKPNVTDQACFTSQVIQDYLTAKLLAQLEEDDFARYTEDLLTNKYLHDVTKLLFAFAASTENKKGLIRIVERLAKANRANWKSISFSKTSTADVFSSADDLDDNSYNYEGQLGHFALSLDCVSQCNDDSITSTIARSLPGKLFMKNNELLTDSQLCGLAKLILQNEPNLKALEIRLDAVGLHKLFSMSMVAKAIAKSAQINTLRVYWTDPQMLSTFLATVFDGNNISIEALKIHDQTRSEGDHVMASVWKGLWAATKGMDQITTFSFTQCHNPALVSGVLRNLPPNVDTLNLSNCEIDQVGAQYLQTAFARNTTRLQKVNLHGVQMKKPDFAYICNGLKTSSGLQELDLSSCSLNSQSIIHLAEALKLNKSLRVLSIAEASIGQEAARALAVSMAMNKTLRKIAIHGADITDTALAEILHTKREGMLLLGHETKIRKLKHLGEV